MSELLFIVFEEDEAMQGAGFAQKLGIPFDLLVLKGESAGLVGAEKVMLAHLPEIPPADGLASGLLTLVQSYSHIAALSSMRSKDIMPRLAGLLNVGMITDVMGIESPTLFRRTIFAGSFNTEVKVNELPVVLTIQPRVFQQTTETPNSTTEDIHLNVQSKAARVSEILRENKRPNLNQAKVVVSGGRPFKDPETFEKLIGSLADHLGGAVGATRVIVDNGIVPNELQVGQTGKTVSPDLYIAVGISGSTQHVAGMKDSKCIVAINNDPSAPIFEIADFGIVGNLYEIVPEIIKLLS